MKRTSNLGKGKFNQKAASFFKTLGENSFGYAYRGW